MRALNRRVSIVGVTVLVTILLHQGAAACTCLEWPPFERAFLESHTVFKGEVVAIESAAPTHPGSVWAALRVRAWWKGAPPDTTSILTAESEAACGFSFVVGREYLVYAIETKGGDLWTHLCWRTHQVWVPVDADLEALGPPVPVSPQSWGTVKELYRP